MAASALKLVSLLLWPPCHSCGESLGAQLPAGHGLIPLCLLSGPPVTARLEPDWDGRDFSSASFSYRFISQCVCLGFFWLGFFFLPRCTCPAGGQLLCINETFAHPATAACIPQEMGWRPHLRQRLSARVEAKCHRSPARRRQNNLFIRVWPSYCSCDFCLQQLV